MALLCAEKIIFGLINWERVLCEILLKINPVFLILRMCKSYLSMTIMCLWTEVLTSLIFALACDSSMLHILYFLWSGGLNSACVLHRYCPDITVFWIWRFYWCVDSWLLSLATRWLWELSCSHSLCETHQYFFVSVLPLLWSTCFGKQYYEALSIWCVFRIRKL